eukprot:578210-Lingulodinium_polyedra.AAC.1
MLVTLRQAMQGKSPAEPLQSHAAWRAASSASMLPNVAMTVRGSGRHTVTPALGIPSGPSNRGLSKALTTALHPPRTWLATSRLNTASGSQYCSWVTAHPSSRKVA